MKNLQIIIIVFLITMSFIPQAYSQQTARGSRPAYVYDNAGLISSEYETLIDNYLRKVDDNTSVEIVIWTTNSFYGHGIKKDNQEII